MHVAFDLGRCAIRVAVDEFDCGLEVQGGLASAIQEHFRVQETGEVLAKVVGISTGLKTTNLATLQTLNSVSPAPLDPASPLVWDHSIALIHLLPCIKCDMPNADSRCSMT